MTDYQYLDLKRENGTVICTINNPPKNFLNAAIMAELLRFVDEIAEDDGARALIITGGVKGIFITHYDVSELVVGAAAARQNERIGASDKLHSLHQLHFKIQRLPIPVIAAINGTAMGGGCELSLGCDFRYMARGGAQFGLPEVRIGLLPGGGGTQRMARLLGVAKALELILLGETLEADAAERLGLIHRAVEPDRLMPEALALAEELGKRPRTSIELIKQCIWQGSELPIEEALLLEQKAFWKTMRTDEAARLMQEYLQGDRPLNEQ